MRRFVFASSCSMYGASGTDDAPRRERAAPAADGLCRVEGARGGGLSALADADFVAGLDAERDRLRRVAAAAPRHRAEQPRRLGSHDRVASASSSDGTPWRPLDPCPRHLARGARDARGTRRSSSAARRSTSAPRSRTTSSVTSQRSLRGRHRMRHRVRGRSFAGPAVATASTSGSSQRRLPRVSAIEWTARRGAVELAEAYRDGRPRPASSSTATASCRLRQIKRPPGLRRARRAAPARRLGEQLLDRADGSASTRRSPTSCAIFAPGRLRSRRRRAAARSGCTSPGRGSSRARPRGG